MLKRDHFIRKLYALYKNRAPFFRCRPLLWVQQYRWFSQQYKNFIHMQTNPQFQTLEWFPSLNDNIGHTPLEPTYFFQDSWAAKHIFSLKPKHHYDVGSSAKTIGIISQFTPTTMIDIRPIELSLENLYFKEGSILELPLEDNSIETLSSLCVVEHIGLGRYGDPIDPFGSEKAISELLRVLCIEGTLLISVPVDSINKIYFNAHRAFTRDYITSLFKNCIIMDEQYHYGNRMYHTYDPLKGFGTGLYMLKKVS